MVHVLVIDNYDSFVYNISQYIQELGSDATVVRNDSPDIDPLIKEVDGIVISPGPGHPRDSNRSLDLATGNHGLPVLGVCLGHQAIAQVHGGTVERNHTVVHGKVCRIHHEGNGVLDGIPDPFTATRYHSLIVRRDGLPQNIRVTAKTESGEIMGITIEGKEVHGLQFHPESVMTSPGRTIVSNFLRMCRT